MPGSWSVELKELIRNVERTARLESLQLLPPINWILDSTKCPFKFCFSKHAYHILSQPCETKYMQNKVHVKCWSELFKCHTRSWYCTINHEQPFLFPRVCCQSKKKVKKNKLQFLPVKFSHFLNLIPIVSPPLEVM